MLDKDHEPFQLALTEELGFMRCFLAENISITNYEFVQKSKLIVSSAKEVNDIPWRAGLNVYSQMHSPTIQEIKKYLLRRKKLLALKTRKNPESIYTSIRRFAVAWENPFKGDVLADLVSALERLVVDDDKEVSYKLKIRVSHFLSKSTDEEKEIYKNLKSAYDYRSTIFHGGYYFDNNKEIDTRKYPQDAKVNKAIKASQEVQRLIPIIANYY